jgi:asparagine synthase (glutamine-hydrolysing)
MPRNEATWDQITELLRHAGQPFADTSLFAVNAVSRLMRRHVTVALSGDGGDEAFGGYNLHWRIAQIARCQRIPVQLWHCGAAVLGRLAQLGILSARWPQRIQNLSGADNTSIIQTLWCWIREEEHARLCRDTGMLPVRRLFEPQWNYDLPKAASRLESLAAQLTEINTRLILPNDFLFKVDTASMKESLEIRVPMLDEDLFSFALSLPYDLNVRGRKGKRVLREIAKRRLPQAIAAKSKHGFGIPLDCWVENDFKARLRDTLLGPSSRLSEFFQPEVYRPIIEAFCSNRSNPAISRQSLYQRAIMLLSVQLATEEISINGSLPFAA